MASHIVYLLMTVTDSINKSYSEDHTRMFNYDFNIKICKECVKGHFDQRYIN